VGWKETLKDILRKKNAKKKCLKGQGNIYPFVILWPCKWAILIHTQLKAHIQNVVKKISINIWYDMHTERMLKQPL
jgi:hypothetical protein